MVRTHIPADGGQATTYDEIFHFHPRATNPELWRTTVPLVVRERCGRHKGLIATWLAIHWLIVLHAASGRAHFGVREIAAEAGVGRNELAGASGHIQRLVGLGLLRIVGYKAFKGLREPRPIYHIDLGELERLSLELVPDVLRDHHIDRPPPVAPDPRQLQLFGPPAEAPPTDRPGRWETGSAPTAPPAVSAGTGLWGELPAPRLAAHEIGRPGAHMEPAQPGGRPEVGTAGPALPADRAGWPASGATTPENGTDRELAIGLSPTSLPESRTVTHPRMRQMTQDMPGSGTAASDIGTATPLSVHSPPEIGTALYQQGTEPARNRDIDRTNERMNEGVSQTLTPNLLQTIITQVTQAVLTALRSHGQQPAPAELPPALTTIPVAPAGAEPLPAPVLALWQGDEPALSRRELHQLALIAAEVDGPSGGFGAYWLGRAILMADLCLGDRGQARSLAYLRRVLRRWREEGSWGSDRAIGEAPARPPVEPAAKARPAAEAPASAGSHPAVRAYIEALREAPNAVQAAQIAATVSDLDAWHQVLTDWQLNGWGERSVGKMLDRYQKCLAPPDAGPPPSVGLVHTYPGLTPEQRDRWIRRFHAATTPAEKRAVLARLEQEHPR